MFRGTTPALNFKLPLSTDLISCAYVTISQGKTNKILIEKDLSQMTKTDKILSVELSQQDTLTLQAGLDVNIQLRIKTISGDAFASNIFTENIGQILKDGEI